MKTLVMKIVLKNISEEPGSMCNEDEIIDAIQNIMGVYADDPCACYVGWDIEEEEDDA